MAPGDKVKVYTKTFTIRTSKRKELVDVTSEVERIVSESGIRNGICVVFVPHATAAVIANEHESGLMQDILEALSRIAPSDHPWLHNRIDDNADAHIIASIVGPSRLFPVINGELVRGTWQNIMIVELDGPRTRRVVVEVIGE